MFCFTEKDVQVDPRSHGPKSTTPLSRTRRIPRDKKSEQVAKEAADYAKKHGVCSVHVPFGPLFVGGC